MHMEVLWTILMSLYTRALLLRQPTFWNTLMLKKYPPCSKQLSWAQYRLSVKDKKWNLDPEFEALSANVFWAVSPAPSWLCILFLLGCRNLRNEELQDGAGCKRKWSSSDRKTKKRCPENWRDWPPPVRRGGQRHTGGSSGSSLHPHDYWVPRMRVRAPSPNRGPWIALFLSTVMWCDGLRSIWLLESRPRTYETKGRQKLGKHNKSYSAEVST